MTFLASSGSVANRSVPPKPPSRNQRQSLKRTFKSPGARQSLCHTGLVWVKRVMVSSGCLVWRLTEDQYVRGRAVALTSTRFRYICPPQFFLKPELGSDLRTWVFSLIVRTSDSLKPSGLTAWMSMVMSSFAPVPARWSMTSRVTLPMSRE